MPACLQNKNKTIINAWDKDKSKIRDYSFYVGATNFVWKCCSRRYIVGNIGNDNDSIRTTLYSQLVMKVSLFGGHAQRELIFTSP